MNLKIIGKDVLRISLNPHDFEIMNVNPAILSSGVPDVYPFLNRLLVIAEKKLNFSVNGYKIAVEVTSNGRGAYILYISREMHPIAPSCKDVSADKLLQDMKESFSRMLFNILLGDSRDEKDEISAKSTASNDEKRKDSKQDSEDSHNKAKDTLLRENKRRVLKGASEKDQFFPVISCVICAFDDFENILSCIHGCPDVKKIPSVLYGSDSSFYLMFKVRDRDVSLLKRFLMLSCEYGGTNYDESLLPYLNEHCHPIIRRGAVPLLMKKFPK